MTFAIKFGRLCVDLSAYCFEARSLLSFYFIIVCDLLFFVYYLMMINIFQFDALSPRNLV